MTLAHKRVAGTTQRQFALARIDRKDHNCWATTIEDAKGLCEFGDRTSSRTLVLFGDSHAEHWLGALDRYGQEEGWKVVAMVKGGCPVADMPELMQPHLKRFYHECTRYREAMVQRIIAMRPDAAILSSWDHYMPRNGSGIRLAGDAGDVARRVATDVRAALAGRRSRRGGTWHATYVVRRPSVSFTPGGGIVPGA